MKNLIWKNNKWNSMLELVIVMTIMMVFVSNWLSIKTQSEWTMKNLNESFINQQINALINRERNLLTSYKYDYSMISLVVWNNNIIVQRTSNNINKKIAWQVLSEDEKKSFQQWFTIWKVNWIEVLNWWKLKDFWWWIYKKELEQLNILLSRDWWITYSDWEWNKFNIIEVFSKNNEFGWFSFKKIINVWETIKIDDTKCKVKPSSYSINNSWLVWISWTKTIEWEENTTWFQITWVWTWFVLITPNWWNCDVNSSFQTLTIK